MGCTNRGLQCIGKISVKDTKINPNRKPMLTRKHFCKGLSFSIDFYDSITGQSTEFTILALRLCVITSQTGKIT